MNARIGIPMAILCLVGTAALAGPRRVDGVRVVSVTLHDRHDVDVLSSLEAGNEGVNVDWHGVRTGRAEAAIAPEQWERFKQSGLDYNVEVEDLQAAIDAVPNGITRGKNWNAGIAGATDFFDDYRTLDEHLQFLQDLADQYPNLATVMQLGTSIENRPIYMLHVTGANTSPKPGVLFNGAQHAREWVTPPAVAYLARHLLDNYGTDPEITGLVDQFDWYLVPIVNVDGYAYTFSTDMGWRKNRRNNGDGTFGVDLNRNWSYGWGGPGASTITSSNTYCGTGPFSEPEAQALSDFISNHPDIRMHVDVHSNVSMLLWPFGATTTLCDDHDSYSILGDRGRLRVQQVHGALYEAGPLADTLYLASGVSTDWAYQVAGMWSLTVECRGPGFIPNPSVIRTVCEENLPLFLYLAAWSGTCDDAANSPDSDGDGFTDCFDACPATDPGVTCICPDEACCDVPGFPPCFFELDPQACIDLGGTPGCQTSPRCRDGCLAGDATQDGALDLADFAALQNCFTAQDESSPSVLTGPSCHLIFDLNNDGHIDLADHATWAADLGT